MVCNMTLFFGTGRGMHTFLRSPTCVTWAADNPKRTRQEMMSWNHVSPALACHWTGNQLYIKSQSDDENFEPVEAYFFDPTEYLEEDLGASTNQRSQKLSQTVNIERLSLTS